MNDRYQIVSECILLESGIECKDEFNNRVAIFIVPSLEGNSKKHRI